MTDTNIAELEYFLIVIELDDVFPRRDPDKPNLYVAKTVSPPEQRFETIQRSKKKHWYSDHVIRLRPDLTPSHFFANAESVKSAYSELVNGLKEQGFTVNQDLRVWTVYVVELDATATKNPGKGYVYVGETSLTAEERFQIHKAGTRNSRGRLYATVVRDHGLTLRPDLAPIRKYFTQAASKQAEKEHAELLKSQGFKVKGGH